MGKVRIGFVGAGSMGQCAHLKNYASIPDCEVVALAEVRPKLRQLVGDRYGIARLYSNAMEMLAKEKLDGIVATQPFNRHGTLLPSIVKTGTPVFIEKPLAATVEAGRKILKALESGRSWLMVGYHKRSDPATMLVKQKIEQFKESSEIGKLKYIRILMPAGDWIQGGFNDLLQVDEPAPPLKCDPPAKDMGEATFREYVAFVNYYIHQVNLMRHLLGEDYTVTYADPAGVTLATVSRSGVAGTIEISPYFTTLDWQESALVAFERGYIKLNLPAPLATNRAGTVEILRDPGNGAAPEVMTPHLPSVHAMRQQAINFIRAIRGEVRPPCEAAEALNDLLTAREYIQLLKKSRAAGRG